MRWSNGRVVDAPFPDWLRQIGIAIAALRSAGARRIVVAGQRMGGRLAAIIYGVQHPDVAGVIAIAPASAPGTLARFPEITESIAKAHQMIAAGQGGQRTTCAEINAGSTISVAGTPTVCLSFVEPGGLADFPQQLPALRVPIIWIAGTPDRTQQRAAAMDATIPANPSHSFVQVIAAHPQTPAAGASAAVDWLKTLPVQQQACQRLVLRCNNPDSRGRRRAGSKKAMSPNRRQTIESFLCPGGFRHFRSFCPRPRPPIWQPPCTFPILPSGTKLTATRPRPGR
jgi:hypothetical protein